MKLARNLPCFFYRQWFDRETFTYTCLLVDTESREAVLIDPVIEQYERDMQQVTDLGVKLVAVLETHVHADHITGAWKIKKKTGAKIGVSGKGNTKNADIQLEDGQEIKVGNQSLKVMATPGHTNGCISYLVKGAVFTGDALFVRGCGRTDFQEGSAETLFDSVREKLFTLPDETQIFPGHNYNGLSGSTIGEEKAFNPRLKLANDKETFVKIMKNLKLDPPEKIDIAVPANLKCGNL